MTKSASLQPAERGTYRVLRGLRAAGTVFLVAAITAADFSLAHVNAATAGFTYVVTVLLIAALWGAPEAVVASLCAAVCFNFFFLPPVFTFTISDPQNWVALVALLTTALVGSRLATTAREQMRAAESRQREMELLYTLSRALLLANPRESLARQITYELARIFEFASVALFDTRTELTHIAGPKEFALSSEALENRLKTAAVTGATLHDPAEALQTLAIRLGGQPIGSLAVRHARVSETALQSLCNLVAISLETERTQREATRLETERKSEILRSTLLDAIAHEFKTPLTSIRAAASALTSNHNMPTIRAQELAMIVGEESNRLERLVTDSIQMARLESGKLKLNRKQVLWQQVIDRVKEVSSSTLETHPISYNSEPGAEMVYGDPELIELAVQHLLDNAARYSAPDSPIDIHASKSDGSVLLQIRDWGPGIAESEQGRIFEKFYRGARTEDSTTGTGMGLHIVREILTAHNGHVWVESAPGEGARFSLIFPQALADAQ